MFRHIDFQHHPFFAKTINVRGSSDFWNSFLAGITKQRGVVDPLAHMDLRGGPRPAATTQTHGMMPIVAQPGQFQWEQRALMQNPNEEERLFRPVVHAVPMYTPEQKELFSKPQSTTVINVERNIRPSLFASRTGVPYLSGVLIPANNDYALINRIMRYDSGTFGRPYDRSELAQGRIFNSLEELYATPDLQGEQARYTEILARLKWYNPAQAQDNPIKPAILIYYDINRALTYQSILLSLSRMMDLKFALLRKFGIRHNIPFVIYRADAPRPQNILTGYFELGDTEDIVEFINSILNNTHPSSTQISAEAFRTQYSTSMLLLQQGIYQLLTSQSLSNPNFADVLRDARPAQFDSPSPYLETVRALTFLVNAGRIDRASLHRSYQAFIAPFLSGSEEERENRFISYGLEADFGTLPEEERLAKINIRFLPPTHPLRSAVLLQTLFHAIANQRIDEVDAMLSTPGIDINAQNAVGQTALIITCQHGYTKIANRLLAMPNVDVNLTDQNGQTALILAAFRNMGTTVTLLLAKPGIDINHQNYSGTTALISACQCGYTEIANRLLAVPDMNVNLRTQNLKTALIWAVRNDMRTTVNLLLAKPGIDINHIDSFGNTAFMCAFTSTTVQFRTPAIIKSFLKHHRNHQVPLTLRILQALATAWKNSQEQMCVLCVHPNAQSFSIFKRRHHCRGCGEAVCAEHSREIRMQTLTGTIALIRYCTTCEAMVRVHA